ncbi:MAG: hypothetical protein GXO02_03750 [Epsilonproteobacteria bacterium]|nr:hypothetical protein [Campylobacterota bacterium]
MYSVEELEYKWKLYRKKRTKRIILVTLFSFLIILLGVVGGYFIFSGSNSSKSSITSNKLSNKVPNYTATVNQNSANMPAKSVSNSIKPKSSSSQKMEIKRVAIDENSNLDEIDLKNAKIVKPNVKEPPVRYIGFNENEKNNKQVVLPNATKKEVNQQEAIKEIEDRFDISKDPKDALFLAKYYYKKKNYAKAEEWAIKANNIDSNNEDTWIIFAKSRAKLGNRVDAIKALQMFYEMHPSFRLKELLDKLRRGKPFD